MVWVVPASERLKGMNYGRKVNGLASVVLLFVLAGSSIGCPSKPRGPVFKPLDGYIVDLGRIEYGPKPITIPIRFQNAGGETLSITNAQTDCDCLVSELPRNLHVAPGMDGRFNLTLEPPSSPNFVRRLFVWTTDPENAPAVITVKGTSHRGVFWRPTKLHVLLEPPQEESHEILFFSDDIGFNIESATTDLENVRVAVPAAETQDKQSVLLTITPLGVVQRRCGKVNVQTNSNVFPRIEIPIIVSEASAYAFLPRIAVLGKQDKEGHFGATVTLQGKPGASSPEGVDILEIVSSSPHLLTSVENPATTYSRIGITCVEPEKLRETTLPQFLTVKLSTGESLDLPVLLLEEDKV